MQSTKIIAESLGYLNKVPDAPSVSEVAVENISNQEHRESEAEAFAQEEAYAQASEDDETFGGQAAVTAVSDSPTPTAVPDRPTPETT